MRRFALAVLLLLAAFGRSEAQTYLTTQTPPSGVNAQSFPSYVGTAGAAGLPLSPTDARPIIQGGLIRKLSGQIQAGEIAPGAIAGSITGPANEVLATPNGSSGSASVRALVPADLPVATTASLGAVKPDNTTITILNGVLALANPLPSGLTIPSPTLTGITTVSGNLQVGPSTLAISGSSASVANSALYGYVGAVHGTYSGSQPAAVFTNFINGFAVDNTGNGYVENTRVYTNFGGNNQAGNFINLDNVLVVNGSGIIVSGSDPFYQAGNEVAQASVNVGGTSLAPWGHLFSDGHYATLNSGATDWWSVDGDEYDISIASGASANLATGVSVILLSNNAVAPMTGVFPAFLVGAQTGATPTITCGMCFTGYEGINALTSTASLIALEPHGGTGSYPQATIAYGIDLDLFATTSYAWRGPNATSLIDGSGNATFASTSTTLTTPGQPNITAIGTSAKITTSGTFAISALSTDYVPASPASGTGNLPASPIDNECHQVVNDSGSPNYSLTISGNGKNIGPNGDTAAVTVVPGPVKFCYSAASGYWSQSL